MALKTNAGSLLLLITWSYKMFMLSILNNLHPTLEVSHVVFSSRNKLLGGLLSHLHLLYLLRTPFSRSSHSDMTDNALHTHSAMTSNFHEHLQHENVANLLLSSESPDF